MAYDPEASGAPASGATFTYDGAGRLVAVAGDDRIITFTYSTDPLAPEARYVYQGRAWDVGPGGVTLG
jgi:hypothetical protein